MVACSDCPRHRWPDRWSDPCAPVADAACARDRRCDPVGCDEQRSDLEIAGRCLGAGGVGDAVHGGLDRARRASSSHWCRDRKLGFGPVAGIACHGAGIGGAPILGDAAGWADRIAKGNDALYDGGINGIPGTGMIAKGGCMNCSDDEVKAAVDYMVENSQ